LGAGQFPLPFLIGPKRPSHLRQSVGGKNWRDFFSPRHEAGLKKVKTSPLAPGAPESSGKNQVQPGGAGRRLAFGLGAGSSRCPHAGPPRASGWQSGTRPVPMGPRAFFFFGGVLPGRASYEMARWREIGDLGGARFYSLRTGGSNRSARGGGNS
jgi:hypothetical protein